MQQRAITLHLQNAAERSESWFSSGKILAPSGEISAKYCTLTWFPTVFTHTGGQIWLPAEKYSCKIWLPWYSRAEFVENHEISEKSVPDSRIGSCLNPELLGTSFEVRARQGEGEAEAGPVLPSGSWNPAEIEETWLRPARSLFGAWCNRVSGQQSE
jgi:hypothetical protein